MFSNYKLDGRKTNFIVSKKIYKLPFYGLYRVDQVISEVWLHDVNRKIATFGANWCDRISFIFYWCFLSDMIIIHDYLNYLFIWRYADKVLPFKLCIMGFIYYTCIMSCNSLFYAPNRESKCWTPVKVCTFCMRTIMPKTTYLENVFHRIS